MEGNSCSKNQPACTLPTMRVDTYVDSERVR